MRILFYYFLPALIPLLLYVISFYIETYRAKKHGEVEPKFFSTKFFNAFIISLVVAIITFLIIFGFMQNRTVSGSKFSTNHSDARIWTGIC